MTFRKTKREASRFSLFRYSLFVSALLFDFFSGLDSVAGLTSVFSADEDLSLEDDLLPADDLLPEADLLSVT